MSLQMDCNHYRCQILIVLTNFPVSDFLLSANPCHTQYYVLCSYEATGSYHFREFHITLALSGQGIGSPVLRAKAIRRFFQVYYPPDMSA